MSQHYVTEENFVTILTGKLLCSTKCQWVTVARKLILDITQIAVFVAGDICFPLSRTFIAIVIVLCNLVFKNQSLSLGIAGDSVSND